MRKEDPVRHTGGRRRRGRGGSALLAVFWAIAVLALAISGWFFWLQERLRLYGEEGRSAEALAMAYSGVAMAMNPGVDRFSSLLQGEVGSGMGYRVEIEGEAARLNLAWLLNGEDRSKIHLFKQWLENVMGLELKDRDRLVDCLLDYVDADSVVRLNGQEDGPGYHPANRMIQSLDELKRVPGMEPLLAIQGWRDQLTLETSGPIDLLEAPESILKLIPGLGDARVARLLMLRAGPDGELHTPDDPKFRDVDQLRSALGMDAKSWERIEKLATAGDQTIRIKSEGYSGKVVRQVEVVVRKGAGTPQIRAWIE